MEIISNFENIINKKHKNERDKILSTKEFKDWFKGSVVVDKKGSPLLVFHSSIKKSFEGINLKLNEESKDWSSYGVYFSSDREATIDFLRDDYNFQKDRLDNLSQTEGFLAKKEKIKFHNTYEPIVKSFSAYLKIIKPLILNNHQELMDLFFSGATRDNLVKQFDGIIIKNDMQFTDQYIVFNPENIKIMPSDYPNIK